MGGKEGVTVEKQLHIQCVYSDADTAEDILLAAFRAFLDRVVENKNDQIA